MGNMCAAFHIGGRRRCVSVWLAAFVYRCMFQMAPTFCLTALLGGWAAPARGLRCNLLLDVQSLQVKLL